MKKTLEQLLSTVERVHAHDDQPPEHEVIAVSETISTAASAYETLRNSLEYDEEHLLRRNAIRRILSRRLEEHNRDHLGRDLLRELIWARYLPNKRVPERMIAVVDGILKKYEPLLEVAHHGSREERRAWSWLLDLLSTEVEYAVSPPHIDEALASFAYQELKERMDWVNKTISEEDHDLQLYVAVHRAVLKSNHATLRFRLLTLYYPAWAKAAPGDAVVKTVSANLPSIITSIETQLRHPAGETLYRVVRKHAVVFHILGDLAKQDAQGFAHMLEVHDADGIADAIAKAAKKRYERFGVRLRRLVIRAVAFLFLTKMLLALVVEVPYEQLVIHEENFTPLLVNILFHPLLLAVIGLTVSLPETKNTAKIVEEAKGLLGMGDDFVVSFKVRRPWAKGTMGGVFKIFYALFFLLTIGAISWFLHSVDFNALSIFFFIFFLSLVTFFGLKIRNTKRELIIIEGKTSVFGTLADILFLPIISAGRWVALRTPKVNIFLYFFDFVVEAPFKALISAVEGWLAYLREKKEEI